MKKNTEIVQIRERKLKDGRISLYLAYRTAYRRHYEYPRMYLLPGDSREVLKKNKQTMQLLNALKAQRIVELTQDRTGLQFEREKVDIMDYAKSYLEHKRKTHRSSYMSFDQMMSYLSVFLKKKSKAKYLSQIDKQFCLDFIDFLRDTTLFKRKNLSATTQSRYFAFLNSMLKKAVNDGFIKANPCDRVGTEDRVHVHTADRVYLEIPELRMLENAEAEDMLVKQAFLFSCFTGLRWSDVSQLRWSDITEAQGTDGKKRYRLSIRMQKTQDSISFVLSNEAIRWMPNRTPGTDLVFPFELTKFQVGFRLKRWIRQSGITKNVTFHSARHTFATMLLTLGADIYTVGKMLGHRNIVTTQIYAKIVDKKKDEAINLIDSFFG